MANVTMELRNVLKHDNFNLFDFSYNITDQNWKEELESRIIARFFFDEIGLESIDRFKHEFQFKMQSIMPYYNKLYETTLFDNDPLTTQRLTEVIENTQDIDSKTDNENTGTQNIDTVNNDNVKNANYPQNMNPASDILDGQQNSEGSGSQERIDNLKNKQTRLDNIKLNQQRVIEGYHRIPYPELLKMHRESILRINSMIMQELKSLFILIY